MTSPAQLKQIIIDELLPPLIGRAVNYPNLLAEKEIKEILNYGRETIQAFSTDEYILSDFGNNKHDLYATVSSMVFQAGWLYATKWHFERARMESGLFTSWINMAGTWEEFSLPMRGMNLSQESYIRLFESVFSRWSTLTKAYWDTPIEGEYMQQAFEGLFVVGAHVPYAFMKL